MANAALSVLSVSFNLSNWLIFISQFALWQIIPQNKKAPLSERLLVTFQIEHRDPAQGCKVEQAINL